MRRPRTARPPARTPRLRTARLDLVPLRPSHARTLWPVLSDSRLYAFIPGPAPASVSELRERFERYARGPAPGVDEEWQNWGLRTRTGRAWVGTLQATIAPSASRASIGYVLGTEHWGRGYAREAVEALVRYLVDVAHLRIIEASVDKRNERSVRLLRNRGFVRVVPRRASQDRAGKDPYEERYRLAHRIRAT